MRLLPQDLGTKWHILTVRNRSLGVASVWTKPTEPRLGTLGKRWIKDLPVSDEVAATTLPLTENKTKGMTWGLGAGLGWIFPAVAIGMGSDLIAAGQWAHFFTNEAITLALGSAWGYLSLIGLPRQHLKKLHETPIDENELTPFLTGNVPGLPHVFGEMAGKLLRFLNRDPDPHGERDGLELSFLSLVRDVLRCETVPENHQDKVRDAVRAIGEALCRLPSANDLENAGSTLLAADKRAEAQSLRARANREADAVVSGSLERQAAALENAAHASENGAVVARRVRALRQELRAQMDVLRLTLPTWGRAAATQQSYVAAHTEETLGNIAQSVQNVAREAVALSDAHDELDAFLGGNSRTYATPAPDVETIRAR